MLHCIISNNHLPGTNRLRIENVLKRFKHQEKTRGVLRFAYNDIPQLHNSTVHFQAHTKVSLRALVPHVLVSHSSHIVVKSQRSLSFARDKN